MNNVPDGMNTQEEEDWEAGEEMPKNLRPSAPAFVPRPPVTKAKPLFQPQVMARRPEVAGSKEEGDDWFGSARRPVSNRQLWESANNAPPPAIVSPSPTHGSMPGNTVKILRRDPASQQKKSPGPSVAGQKSLSEREEEYRLARERIFGKEAAAAASGVVSAGQGRSPIQSGKSSPAERNFDLVPTQVKRSPVSREGTPGALNGGGGGSGLGSRSTSGSGATRGIPGPGAQGGPGGAGREKDKGVIRQPRGPGMGGGFARA